MSNFLLKEWYQAYTIELRSIVIPRSKEHGQFQFVEQLEKFEFVEVKNYN